MIDHLQTAGGEANIRPQDAIRVTSVLDPNGFVSWMPALETSKNKISVEMKNIHWELLQNDFGKSGLSSLTYFYREIKTDKPKTVLIKTKNVHHFYVNSIPYFGQEGNDQFYEIPLPLQSPVNRIMIAVTSYGPPSFEFEIEDLDRNIEIVESDITKPDLIGRNLPDYIWMGVPIQNRSDQWIKGIRIQAKIEDMYFGSIEPKFEIAPRSTLKFPLRMKRISNVSAEKDLKLEIKLFLNSENPRSIEVPIKTKNIDQASNHTFLADRDGSVQEYSILYPKNYNPNQSYSLIIALHGAHVTNSVALETYAPKDWAFVVTPSDRRALGSGWRGAGVDDLLQLIQSLKKDLPIQDKQIILAGHSMGGHGVWDIGLQHPDLFAGLAPSAAWTSRARYIPEYLQSAELKNLPNLKEIRERAQLSENTPALIWNALNLPVYSTHATEDPVVNILHQNIFLKELKDLGYEFQSKAVLSKEHWCKEPLVEGKGYECVDHPSQWEYLRNHFSGDTPKHIRFETSDLYLGNQAYWIHILKQERAFWPSRIEAFYEDKRNAIKIFSQNIKNLEIDLPPQWVSKDLKIYWNQKEVKYEIEPNKRISLGAPNSGFSKSPSLYGGISRAFAKPYLIVVRPADHDETLTQLRLHQARLLSDRLWLCLNSFSPIIFDQDLPKHFNGTQNLVFIGPSLEDSELNKVLIDQRKAGLKNYAIISNFPRKLGSNTVTAQFYGESLVSQDLVTGILYNSFREQSLLPDFLVFNEDFYSKGWSGISIAGFYSPDWKFSKADLAIEGL